MLAAIFGIIVTLVIYYFLWLLWLWIAPKFVLDPEYDYLVRPKFWQFAITLFAVLFLLRKI